MKRFFSILFFAVLFISQSLFASKENPLKVNSPEVVLTGISFTVEIEPALHLYLSEGGQEIPYRIIDRGTGEELSSGVHLLDAKNPGVISDTLLIDRSGRHDLQVYFGEYSQMRSLRAVPAILSIVPPLLAIILALITRQVIVALFFGIWIGVTFIYDYNPLIGFLHTVDQYIIQSINSTDNISILIFSLVLGGMVGVITRSGGTQGIVDFLTRYANDSRRGQLATWAMGIFIFFDDYANTLIVGNTMRPLTDKLRISREKLSYLVDSTAAPVANIAIISTWIGYELGLIKQSLDAMNVEMNSYLVFIRTIPLNFYPIYALVFGFLVAYLLRDFGPMWKAERRVNTTGEVLSPTATPLSDVASSELNADENIPKRWMNAVAPVLTVILVVMVGLLVTGWKNVQQGGTDLTGLSIIRKLSIIVGNSDSFAVLAWAAFTGSIVAIVMAISQRILNLHDALDAWVKGIRSMVMAFIILVAAWTIGNICQDLFTADYVIHLTKTFLSPHWLPLVIFITSAAIAFATGTSWGTMAILMPIAIPLAHKFPLTHPGIDAAHATALMLSSTAAVLAGATFGDHCSPISDTTIMSSMASGSDHIDHVRTQLPYALTTGAVACLFGYIPVGFGITNWVVLPLGILIVFLIIRFKGKPIIDSD
ncbi:MAG: Na+/H+ antiporter NhaC family protein [Calditrichia bacterium]